MRESRALVEMSEDEVLDFADACAETARRAEVDLLRAAYQWAVLHSADRLDPAESWLPGRERARQLGGPGVPSDGRIPWTRFEALVAAKVAQAAPALAREKEERAARATFAKKLGGTARDEAHGMSSFLVRADLATIEAIEAVVAARAARLAADHPDAPHLQTDDQRRVHAFVLLVTGAPDETETTQLLPDVTLFVHTYAGPDAEDIVRVEGHGPVTQEWVRQTLGSKARFTIRPVLDLEITEDYPDVA